MTAAASSGWIIAIDGMYALCGTSGVSSRHRGYTMARCISLRMANWVAIGPETRDTGNIDLECQCEFARFRWVGSLADDTLYVGRVTLSDRVTIRTNTIKHLLTKRNTAKSYSDPRVKATPWSRINQSHHLLLPAHIRNSIGKNH